MSTSERLWTWEEDGYTVIRSHARTAPGCHNHCGVLMYVKDGKLAKVEGDPENPYSQGRLCARCLSVKDVVDSPMRLTEPLKRAGARGENKWEKISWDEAYDLIEQKFKQISEQYGPESIIVTQGTGRDNMGPSGRLAYAIGTPNWTIGFLSGNACYMPRVASMIMMAGGSMVADCGQYWEDKYNNPEWKRPDVMVIWGNNPVVANADGFIGHWVIDLMKMGTKLIVIDPRLTWLASKADLWLQIRPGTDGALALAMLNIIIGEKLYDQDFVEKWVHGFEELSERVAQYPVSKVSEITWIPEELIYKAARMYAAAKPGSIQWGLAIDQAKEGVGAAMAINCLVAITGNIDVGGGNVFINTPFGIVEPQWLGGWGFDALSEETAAKRLGIDKYPMLQLGFLCTSSDELMHAIEDGEPYPVKAAFLMANNAIACMGADSQRVYRALNSLEFNVVVDPFMTPTALAIADVVLPSSFWPERPGMVGYAGLYLGAMAKGVEAQGNAKSDWQIMIELGKRFNPELIPWNTEEEMYSDIFSAAGMNYEEMRAKTWVYPPFAYKKYEKGLMRPDGTPGFATTTGKFEAESTLLGMWGLDPLPLYEEPSPSPLSTPELTEKYPLVLTTGARNWGMFHSEHRQIPKLRKLHPEPIVEIHPDDGAAYGIKDGDMVWIENHLGRCKQKAKFVPTILKGVVMADHAWWFPERDADDGTFFGVFEAGINQLIPMGDCGRTGFGAPYKSSICRVYKVEGGEQ